VRYLAALKYLALMGAAIFAFASSPKVQAAWCITGSSDCAYESAQAAAQAAFTQVFGESIPTRSFVGTDAVANDCEVGNACPAAPFGQWFKITYTDGETVYAHPGVGVYEKGGICDHTLDVVEVFKVRVPGTFPYPWVPGSGQTIAELPDTPSTCYNGCTYVQQTTGVFWGEGDVSAPTNTANAYRVGDWSGNGVVCTSSPGSGGGGGGNGSAGGGSGEALGDITSLGGGGSSPTSVIGGMLQFPTFGLFESHGTRVCALDIALPASDAFNMIRSAFGDSLTISFCAYTERIDRIGGFLLYVFTALMLWGLFRMTPGG
jgi:hypothetical protein